MLVHIQAKISITDKCTKYYATTVNQMCTEK